MGFNKRDCNKKMLLNHLKNMKILKRPYLWFLVYFLIIIAFTIIYICLPKTDWGGCESINIVIDSLYFSVVTITTLGFGDVFPESGTTARIFVTIEAILGILSIGFFLNDLAIAQSQRLDDENKRNEDERMKEIATKRLVRYKNILNPVFERYLRGVYEVVTPLDRRNSFEDIFNTDFKFQFKDLQELYGPSLLMTNDFEISVVSAHFKNQHILYNELKGLFTGADLSYWPDLEDTISQFFRQHNNFPYEDIIIKNGLILHNTKSTPGNIAIEMIKKTEGEPEYKESNIINAYVALYYHLKSNIHIVKNIMCLLERSTEGI